MRLEGKIAIVTGAARGIGRACAERLLADGAKVVVADIDEAQLNETAAAIGTADTVLAGSSGSRVDVGPGRRLSWLTSPSCLRPVARGASLPLGRSDPPRCRANQCWRPGSRRSRRPRR